MLFSLHLDVLQPVCWEAIFSPISERRSYVSYCDTNTVICSRQVGTNVFFSSWAESQNGRTQYNLVLAFQLLYRDFSRDPHLHPATSCQVIEAVILWKNINNKENVLTRREMCTVLMTRQIEVMAKINSKIMYGRDTYFESNQFGYRILRSLWRGESVS